MLIEAELWTNLPHAFDGTGNAEVRLLVQQPSCGHESGPCATESAVNKNAMLSVSVDKRDALLQFANRRGREIEKIHVLDV